MRSDEDPQLAQASQGEMFAPLRCGEMPARKGVGAVDVTPASDWSMTVSPMARFFKVGDLGETFHGLGVRPGHDPGRPSRDLPQGLREIPPSTNRHQQPGCAGFSDTTITSYRKAPAFAQARLHRYSVGTGSWRRRLLRRPAQSESSSSALPSLQLREALDSLSEGTDGCPPWLTIEGMSYKNRRRTRSSWGPS